MLFVFCCFFLRFQEIEDFEQEPDDDEDSEDAWTDTVKELTAKVLEQEETIATLIKRQKQMEKRQLELLEMLDEDLDDDLDDVEGGVEVQ